MFELMNEVKKIKASRTWFWQKKTVSNTFLSPQFILFVPELREETYC